MIWCVSRIVFPLVVIWLRRCCFLLNCVLIYFWYLIVLIIWVSYGMVLAYMNVVLFRLRGCSCVFVGYRYLVVAVGCGVFGAGVVCGGLLLGLVDLVLICYCMISFNVLVVLFRFVCYLFGCTDLGFWFGVVVYIAVFWFVLFCA